ncbi:VWA domain-containing protein [Neorhizobium sp. T786]|uniref:TadE/TadG family type IV pilus assembly protein n=1 Tax=Pseudorhizobium xiangyangii TaxID=2883104 RepID=UPI001CFFA7FC|nr:TadE/TadG family type IV pilus assembly protein [Neorhizobium xiangyangii]MCB5204346.1 VWA domain-containing protein [Neorhizobium xiangyangii]
MVAWQFFSRLLKDRAGNFGMMTAILLPVMLGAGGIAIDVTNMMMSKTQLQDAADAASLAASTAMANGQAANDEEAELLARQFFIGQVANYFGDDTAEKIGNSTAFNVTTTINGTSKKYDVGVNSTYGMALTPLMGVLGYETMNIAVNSASTSGTEQTRAALSMYLALDRSGSMSFMTNETKSGTCDNYTKNSWSNPTGSNKPCYIRKIEALQAASHALVKSLSDADPEKNLVRLGAVSYNDQTQTPKAMAWGTDHVKTYVDSLPYKPTGGTDASGAMEYAYKALVGSNNTEASAHTLEKNGEFQRYILLMTDGEMTGNGSSFNSPIDQKVRGWCDDAKKDAIIIFSVAFMAPDNGKKLLNYCASGSENYFQPDTMAKLVATFDAIGKKAAKSATRLTH